MLDRITRFVTDTFTAALGFLTALGVSLSWWDLLSYGYSGLMTAGAALLMVLRVAVAYREWQAGRRRLRTAQDGR